MRLIFFVLVSIVLMVVDHRQGHLDVVRAALSTLVYPLQFAVNLPVEVGRRLSETLVTQKFLIEENNRFREEHQLMNSKLQRFVILEEENKRLRQLLGSSIRFKERILIAELLSVELEPHRQLVEINKGFREGAYDGQPVVDASGVIGQIIHVGPFSSKVLLITDPSHALPVQVNRNGLRAIAVGTGQANNLLLQHLPTNADIHEGDLIISSGLGHRFPRGYPVGTISSITLEPGAHFAKVAVTPSAKLTQNREVLLVWPYEIDDETTMGAEVAMNR